jgi:4-hydroxy-tetrahydrodipicolinate reductase
VFRSANMSLGIAVLLDLARRAARMFPDADVEIVEAHHNQKLDVPSGTALMLANAVRSVRPEAEFVVGRHENGKRKKSEIGIHSLRLGNEVGMHEILITTGNETLTLKHEAESRALFAEGALAAAAWLMGKPAGLYNMQDLLEESL